MAHHIAWGAIQEMFISLVLKFSILVLQLWIRNSSWRNWKQLANGETQRSFDSFTTCQEEGCFMGTMRLLLGHQTEWGLLHWIFLMLYWKDWWKSAAVHVTEYISIQKSQQNLDCVFPLNLCFRHYTIFGAWAVPWTFLECTMFSLTYEANTCLFEEKVDLGMME